MNKFNKEKGDELMFYQNDIANLQESIKDNIGQKVIVKGSLGRCKNFEKEATIQKAYQNIFIVKYDETERDVSYQYKDVLTRSVELDLFDGETYSSIIPPLELTKRKNKRVKA